jgi:hypothetical protein
MSRWLRHGLLLFALCCGACAGTETGNPDPSSPREDGGAPQSDAGTRPRNDGGSASDAGVSLDASVGEDGGTQLDGGLIDAGPDEDAGDVEEDAG